MGYNVTRTFMSCLRIAWTHFVLFFNLCDFINVPVLINFSNSTKPCIMCFAVQYFILLLARHLKTHLVDGFNTIDLI